MSDSTDVAALDALPAYAAIPPMGGPVGALIRGLDRLFATLAVLGLLAIAAVVILQIVARVALPSSPVWTEELSRYLFIHMIAVSSGLVLRQHRHVGVELFQHTLGFRAQMALRGVTSLVLAVFSAVVLPYAWTYAQIGAFQTSPTLGIPMIYIFSATAILFGLSAVYGALGVIEAGVAFVRGSKEHT
ncbi:TRAP transporter small permease [Larsenimonas suaedae]|uniref:TRAP transporter small permease protein n=1 Tax=Larsenimonas suaedae TaxID=1851019 RepID=A0ABU1GVU5_9GAMM|nr:TRAP transporter small permease [Larsenimonas suaedae]MCM2973272.1 TRAP transporter small permease [Larsenimonas suaedae]MDR5896165.1 TRAP transporter small permease [Larsenimonas suaedae]